jgi:uncharacterized membrane protein (GlpM family)
MEMLLRFLIGGAVVSLFAALGDMVRPKSFAGIFGAAPSIALATLALTVHSRGGAYASLEARSMMVGAAALLGYAWVSCRVLWPGRFSAVAVTLCALPIWLVLALLGWFTLLGGA